MRGSVVLIGTRNKQSCFSLNKNKKTQLIYLGKNRQARAKEYSENYKKLRAIVEQTTMINMVLLKENTCLWPTIRQKEVMTVEQLRIVKEIVMNAIGPWKLNPFEKRTRRSGGINVNGYKQAPNSNHSEEVLLIGE